MNAFIGLFTWPDTAADTDTDTDDDDDDDDDSTGADDVMSFE